MSIYVSTVQQTSVTLNVKNMGATGNGVTDDSAAFQAAINAVCNIGGTLYVPQGRYLIGTTLNIPLAMMMMGDRSWGNGQAQGSVIIAKPGLNANLIQFNPAANVSIFGAAFRDLCFQGNGPSQNGGNIFYALGAVHCSWLRCWFNQPYLNGLYLFQDGHGGTGHHNTVMDCLFDQGANAGAGSDGRGLLIQASDENYIIGCDFESNGSAASGTPTHLWERSGLQTIIGCCFVGGASGIKCEGSGGTRISACIFDGCGSPNIHLNGPLHIVEGCAFWNLGALSSANTCVGVQPDNVAETKIIGCQFMPSTPGAKCAVDLSLGPATNTTVEHNNFSTSTGVYGTSAVILGTGSGNKLHANRGYNPVGASTPSVPGSGSDFFPTGAMDYTAYIAGGTISNIKIGGVSTGLTSGTFRVPNGVPLNLTYTVAPTTFLIVGD